MTDEDARALVEHLFPLLRIRTFEPVGSGWTVDTYDVNGGWIVQLPRSEDAADRILRQIELLPNLAHELSALVPVPELVSFDPPVMGYRRLEGVPLDEAPEGCWPERLGRFLYDLHLIPPELVGLRARPASVVREESATELATIRARALPLLDPRERDLFGSGFDAYLDDDANWRFAPCLVHGDIGPEHVLVSASGDLVGVLGWEELSVNDPAADFAWLLHARPADGERVLAAYGGPPDPSFRTRARFRYTVMPFHEVLNGLNAGEEAFVASGIRGVRARAEAQR